MASVDKVKIGSTSYDVSPSKNGTLTGYTSNDAASPTAWTASDVITTSDTNSSIFAKVTTMVKNIRWLYAKLGTTDFSSIGDGTVSGALSTLNTNLANKANASHTHTTAQLPVSSTQVNSTSYIPTSSLVYSMQQQITSLNDAIDELALLIDDPNDRNYDATSLGTWSSLSQVDTFLATYNRASAYKTSDNKLRIGNRITISDGTYNAVWMIAGFDLESSRKASDDTTYDNGYGIALVPVTQLTTGKWNEGDTLSGAYMSSYMHNTTMPTVATNLKKVLGSHLVQRNVLLSSSVSSGKSNAYTWTTAYCTLMSIGQMNGTFASYNNKYDDGEANYKLPVFNKTDFKTGSGFWSRCVYGSGCAWFVNSGGSISNDGASYSIGVRPLIYIR